MNRFILNETSYHGAGAVAAIKDEAAGRGFKKALVPTPILSSSALPKRSPISLTEQVLLMTYFPRSSLIPPLKTFRRE